MPDEEVDQIIDEVRKAKGITPRKISNEEIVQRCIYALINEGARILEEGIALRASDIDVAYIYGYGFPPFRGGPMQFADATGLFEVAQTLKKFAAEPGVEQAFWTPAALIEKLIAEGNTFNS